MNILALKIPPVHPQGPWGWRDVSIKRSRGEMRGCFENFGRGSQDAAAKQAADDSGESRGVGKDVFEESRIGGQPAAWIRRADGSWEIRAGR